MPAHKKWLGPAAQAIGEKRSVQMVARAPAQTFVGGELCPRIPMHTLNDSSSANGAGSIQQGRPEGRPPPEEAGARSLLKPLPGQLTTDTYSSQ